MKTLGSNELVNSVEMWSDLYDAEERQSLATTIVARILGWAAEARIVFIRAVNGPVEHAATVDEIQEVEGRDMATQEVTQLAEIERLEREADKLDESEEDAQQPSKLPKGWDLSGMSGLFRAC